MTEFLPRPYRMFNKIQNYDWGSRGGNAFIPRLLGIQAEAGKPYAELWMGAHPKAPSEIVLEGRRVPLDAVIAEFNQQCLGDYVSNRFSGRLPFLLKVLSAEKALSIQLHPDKKQAERLHRAHPENYPDDNHKPEMAVALDSLEALAGFRPVSEISAMLRNVPELGDFADRPLFDSVLLGRGHRSLEDSAANLYAYIMRKADRKEELADCIGRISDRLSRKGLLLPEEEEFLRQHAIYGNDIGLFSHFFLNMVRLKPGQAIFTDAGIPHAYLRGNIVECMANSDNVVRAGLTPKFKDVETLLEIVKYRFAPCEIVNSGQEREDVVYKTKAAEFRINRFDKPGGFNRNFVTGGNPSVFLILNGKMTVEWEEADNTRKEDFSKGDSFFVPASLPGFAISSAHGVDCFFVDVP